MGTDLCEVLQAIRNTWLRHVWAKLLKLGSGYLIFLYWWLVRAVLSFQHLIGIYYIIAYLLKYWECCRIWMIVKISRIVNTIIYLTIISATHHYPYVWWLSMIISTNVSTWSKYYWHGGVGGASYVWSAGVHNGRSFRTNFHSCTS